jgi:hypothetical protein
LHGGLCVIVGGQPADLASDLARTGRFLVHALHADADAVAARNETEHWKERPYLRPLVVFRGNSLFGCTQDRQTVFRRDFDNGSEGFDAEWFKGWDTYARARKGGELWQSQRLAKNTRWTAAPLGNGAAGNGGANGSNEPVAAMILTRNAVVVVGSQGRLAALSHADGKTLAELRVPPIAWDALAAIEGRLVLSTQDGQVVCLGRE